MSPRRPPRAPRTAAKNVRMLVTTRVVLTDGETPLLVIIRPCTIHGCRPFSVSIQPAVLMTNGSGTAQTASRRTTRAVEVVRARSASTPRARRGTPGPRCTPSRASTSTGRRRSARSRPGPYCCSYCGLHLVEALHLPVPGVRGQQGQQVRDLNDLRGRLVARLPPPISKMENGRAGRSPTAPRRPRSSSVGTCPRRWPRKLPRVAIRNGAGQQRAAALLCWALSCLCNVDSDTSGL